MSVIANSRKGRAYVDNLQESPIAKVLFGDVRWSWIWLIVRLYVGYEWLSAGYEKLINPAWVGAKAGTGMAGFITGALAKVGGAHPAVAGWYGSFLSNVVQPNIVVWSYLITFGELLVGIGLIVGMFTGIAAFFGGFMNLNYLLAGTTSTNPVLLILAVFLVLAWRTAGWWGLDHFVLPSVGTPWHRGLAFKEEKVAAD